ncbi:MAG: hypothetical protein ACKO37_06805 [Vampirovibrionales bacterium]
MMSPKSHPHVVTRSLSKLIQGVQGQLGWGLVLGLLCLGLCVAWAAWASCGFVVLKEDTAVWFFKHVQLATLLQHIPGISWVLHQLTPLSMALATHMLGLVLCVPLLMAWQARTVVTLGGKQALPSLLNSSSWWVVGCFFSMQAVWLEWFQPTGQFVWLALILLMWHLLLSWGETLRDEQRRRPPVSLGRHASWVMWQYHLTHAGIKYAIPLGVSALVLLQTWVAGGVGLMVALAYVVAQLQFLYGWHPLMAQRAAVRTFGWLVVSVLGCIALRWISLDAWWLQLQEALRYSLQVEQLWLNPLGTLKFFAHVGVGLLRDPFPWTGFMLIVLLDLMEKLGWFSLGGVRQTRQRPGLWLLQQDMANHPPVWLLGVLTALSLFLASMSTSTSHASSSIQGLALYPSIALWLPILLPRLVSLLEDWVLTAPQDHRKDMLFWVHRVFPFGLVFGSMVSLMVFAQGLPAVMQPGVDSLEAWLHTLALPSAFITMFQVLETAAFWKLPLYALSVWMLLGGSFLWLLQQEVSRRQWLKGLVCWCLGFWVLMSWAVIPVLGRYGDAAPWVTQATPMASSSRQSQDLSSSQGVSAVWLVPPYAKDVSVLWLARTPLYALPELKEFFTEQRWLAYQQREKGLEAQETSMVLSSSTWLPLSDERYFAMPHYQRRQWQLIQTMTFPRRPLWVSVCLGLTPTAMLYQEGGDRWLHTEALRTSSSSQTTPLTPLSDTILEQYHLFKHIPQPWY